jgi:hypothetical protein
VRIVYNISNGTVDAEHGAETKDVSGQALWAVAHWLEVHDAGEPYEIYTHTGDYGYRLTVERIGAFNDGA